MSFVIILINNLIILMAVYCFPCPVALNINTLLDNQYTTVCLYDQLKFDCSVNISFRIIWVQKEYMFTTQVMM